MSIAAAFGIIGSVFLYGLVVNSKEMATISVGLQHAMSAVFVSVTWAVAWFISWVTQ